MPSLAEFLVALVTPLLYVFFYSSLLKPKRSKWLTVALLLVLELSLSFSMMFFLQTRLFTKILIYLAAEMTFMLVFYEGTFVRKLTLFFLNYVLGIAAETLAYFVYEFIVKAVGLQENYDLMMALVICFNIMLYVYAVLLLQRDKESRLNTRETAVAVVALFLTYFMLTMCAIFIAPPEGLRNDYPVAWLLVGNFAIGLILNIILLWLLKGMAKSRRVEAENALLAEQNKRQLEHYEALSRYQGEIRELRHDITNHIDAAMSLLENGNSEKAAEYISELQSRYRNISAIDFCDNPVIDALLRNKAQLFEERGTSYSYNVSLKQNAGIDDLSLVAVFANMLDNAAEAASLVKSNPFVRLNVRENAGFLFIKCENSVDESAQPLKKDDELRHGLGTGIIERAVAEHDGSFERTISDGICTCLCSMRLEGEAVATLSGAS